MSVAISPGFTDAERPLVAGLYWAAFSQKLGRVMGPDAKALDFLARQISPEYAVCARDPAGAILGVAGFKTAEGTFIGGGLRDLALTYGWPSALWRGMILSVIERGLATDVLLMDGICVAAAARGQGVGTALLDAIKEEARARGLGAVRLDVINTNPRARALYLSQGFKETTTEQLGPLKWIFGFDSATQMICRLSDQMPQKCRDAAN